VLDGRLLLPGSHSLIVLHQVGGSNSDGRRMHLETLAAVFLVSVERGVDSVMIQLNLS
jgi:hypothetical protein